MLEGESIALLIAFGHLGLRLVGIEVSLFGLFACSNAQTYYVWTSQPGWRICQVVEFDSFMTRNSKSFDTKIALERHYIDASYYLISILETARNLKL